MAALAKVEQAILEMLASQSGEEVHGRDLRGMLTSRGFRRSAPALVFTMMSLVDKGFITCREEVRVVDGVEVRKPYYSQEIVWITRLQLVDVQVRLALTKREQGTARDGQT